jgi:hypothetical protein
MHEGTGTALESRWRVPGCRELGINGWLDPSGCCERCHSAGDHMEGALGPCSARLPDGTEVFVCCTGKKQIMESSGSM